MALDSLESERLWNWLGRLDGRLDALERDFVELKLELERHQRQSIAITRKAGGKVGGTAGAVAAAAVTLLSALAQYLMNHG